MAIYPFRDSKNLGRQVRLYLFPLVAGTLMPNRVVHLVVDLESSSLKRAPAKATAIVERIDCRIARDRVGINLREAEPRKREI
jgi:hypothetical protein